MGCHCLGITISNWSDNSNYQGTQITAKTGQQKKMVFIKLQMIFTAVNDIRNKFKYNDKKIKY